MYLGSGDYDERKTNGSDRCTFLAERQHHDSSANKGRRLATHAFTTSFMYQAMNSDGPSSFFE